MKFGIIVLLLVAAPLAATLAQNTYTSTLLSNDSKVLEICTVSALAEVDVPAQVEGPLSSVSIQQNQYVQKDAVLATIDDRQAQLQKFAAETQLKASRLKANDDIEVLTAEATLELAEKELERETKLRQSGANTSTDLERAQLAVKQAELQVQRAKHLLEVAKMNAEVDSKSVESSDYQLQRHQIAAPIDGNVTEMYREEGEWVKVGEPVFKIARMDKLRISGAVGVSQFNPDEIMGKPVEVEFTRARGQVVTFNGYVESVDLNQRGSKTINIRAEVENRAENNRWMLLPGAQVKMTIQL